MSETDMSVIAASMGQTCLNADLQRVNDALHGRASARIATLEQAVRVLHAALTKLDAHLDFSTDWGTTDWFSDPSGINEASAEALLALQSPAVQAVINKQGGAA